MLDISIVLAVSFAVLAVILIRATITLADISNSLEKLAGTGTAAASSVAQAPARAASQADRPAQAAAAAEPDDTEIAAIIAIAKAAADGRIAISQRGN